jgi:DNA-binding FadR family transcriptional regulator
MLAHAVKAGSFSPSAALPTRRLLAQLFRFVRSATTPARQALADKGVGQVRELRR